MTKLSILLALLCSLVGCVGDSSTTDDAGGDASAAKDGASVDAPSGTCQFGTSHFGDGCKFGP